MATRTEELLRLLSAIEAALEPLDGIRADVAALRGAVERSETEVRGDIEALSEALLQRLNDLYTELRSVAFQSERNNERVADLGRQLQGQILVLSSQIEQLAAVQRLSHDTSLQVVEAARAQVEARSRDDIIAATIRRTDEITAQHHRLMTTVPSPTEDPARAQPSRLRSAVLGAWPLLVAGGLVVTGALLLDHCRAPVAEHGPRLDMLTSDLAEVTRPLPPAPPPKNPKRPKAPPRPAPPPPTPDVKHDAMVPAGPAPFTSHHRCTGTPTEPEDCARPGR